MAKTTTKVTEIDTFEDLLNQAKTEKKSMFQILANLNEEIGSKLKINKFLSRTEDDIKDQVKMLEREVEDLNDDKLNLAFKVADYGTDKMSRLNFVTKLISLNREQRNKQEDIEDWNDSLAYFQKAA